MRVVLPILLAIAVAAPAAAQEAAVPMRFATVVGLALEPDRSALFAWTDLTATGTPVYPALAAPRGNLREPQQIADGAIGGVFPAFGRPGRAFVAASVEGAVRVYRYGPDTLGSFVLDREIRPGGEARLWSQAGGSVLLTVALGGRTRVLALG